MRGSTLFLRLLLRLRARRAPVLRALQGIPEAPRPEPHVGEVRVAAIQMPFGLFRTGEAFARAVRRAVRRAAEGGAELVVFPEDLGTTLLGIIPGFERLESAGSVDAALATLGDGVSLADVVAVAGPSALRIYRTVLEEVAKAYAIHIQGGSILLPWGDGRVFNVAYLFGPRGLLGAQKKCHLLPLEADWGLAAGDDLHVFDTAVGRLAQPVCMDATYFETFRILEHKGAEIVCLPTADPDPEANVFKALRGLWPRVQESAVFGVQAAMVGGALGLEMHGRSAVCAPMALTPKGDGYLARASGDGEEVVFATLDLEALRAYRREPPIRANREFEAAHFPGIYQGFWRGGIVDDPRRQ